MKPTTLSMIVAALLLAISASVAADKPATQPADKTADKTAQPVVQKPSKAKAKAKAAKEQRVNVTGSYIKQKVDKNGVIVSAGPSPLIVLDSETIARTGASDIADLFRRGGWAH